MHSNIDKFTMDSCIFISNNIQYVTGQKERNNLQAFSDVDLNVFCPTLCTRSKPGSHHQMNFIVNLQKASDELPGNTHVDMGSMMTKEDFLANS